MHFALSDFCVFEVSMLVIYTQVNVVRYRLSSDWRLQGHPWECFSRMHDARVFHSQFAPLQPRYVIFFTCSDVNLRTASFAAGFQFQCYIFSNIQFQLEDAKDFRKQHQSKVIRSRFLQIWPSQRALPLAHVVLIARSPRRGFDTMPVDSKPNNLNRLNRSCVATTSEDKRPMTWKCKSLLFMLHLG